MTEISVGQVWIEKTTRTPVAIVSINRIARAVFVSGLPPNHCLVTMDDLRKNCQLLQDWGRASAIL